MSGERIELSLSITFDKVGDLADEVKALDSAIRNRIFGEGVFGPETEVDTWACTIEEYPIPVEEMLEQIKSDQYDNAVNDRDHLNAIIDGLYNDCSDDEIRQMWFDAGLHRFIDD